MDLDLAPSKTKAKELIQTGVVILSGVVHKKPGQLISDKDSIYIKVLNDSLLRYVSRGGLKLEGALKKTNIKLNNKIALDIGSSTGGFSECLILNNAKNVVGFDVGENQIHPKMKVYSNFLNFEKVHFQEAENHKDLSPFLAAGFDIIVADISFISLTKLFPFVFKWLKQRGEALLLVKPQFELSAKDLNRSGVVKNQEMYDVVRENIIKEAQNVEFRIMDFFPSELTGKDGNKEFFIWVKKESTS